MRIKMTAFLTASTLSMTACHPTNTPATSGQLNNTAQTVSAGSAPAGSDDGVAIHPDLAASRAQAAADANTASAAIAAQRASAPDASMAASR